jgi:hypothetical protein
MQRLNSERFLHLFRNLHELRGLMTPVHEGGITRQFSFTVDEGTRSQADELTQLLLQIGLPMSYMEAQRFQSFVGASSVESTAGWERIRSLSDRIGDELSSKFMLILSETESALFVDEAPFGKHVSKAFPSASEDIDEAAKCLSLQRATASVMHLMRVAEVGLKALADKVGVSSQKDWGSYLREIEKQLTVKAKSAGFRSEDEQFFSEASLGFDNIKRAWRNPTMHVDRAYTQDQAEEIFASLKSFMGQLSSKVHE